jgi:16S rRNA (guanine966-N2)-methyltransferase
MGRLRIVAGDLRGRKIDVPPGSGVRPTPDRVREALFSILADRLAGASVLDLFSGSGALGLEALSRGAAAVTFVEADRAVARVLSTNVGRLAPGRTARVVVGDALAVVGGPGLRGGPFDLVLADPPYAEDLADRILEALAGCSGLLTRGAWIVLEGEASEPPVPGPASMRHVRRARYGRTALDFYQFPGSPDSP